MVWGLLRLRIGSDTLSLLLQSKSQGQPKSNGWGSKLHLLMEGVSKSHCKGCDTGRGGELGPFLETTPYEVLRSGNLRRAEIQQREYCNSKWPLTSFSGVLGMGLVYLKGLEPGWHLDKDDDVIWRQSWYDLRGKAWPFLSLTLPLWGAHWFS